MVEWASGVELASCQFQYMLGRPVGGQCFAMGWGAVLIALLHCPPYICLVELASGVELASCQFQYYVGAGRWWAVLC
ncbi:hypothetical protein [Moorena producens]|uniref:hypothetical protein n=1 Tax=Moorena producens TaxID=1155739 RepID=UPI0011EA61DB|nr:hypothetical protein [Moorena producens]